MKKKNTEPTLDPIWQKVLDDLRAIDIEALFNYYSVPPIDKADRDDKIRGILLLSEALLSLQFAKKHMKPSPTKDTP